MTEWPIVVLEDRYNGTYSGGKWVAFELRDESPELLVKMYDGTNASDGPCRVFWDQMREEGGKWWAVGATPDEAVATLNERYA
jgi:hypothetical protein